jgi:hypothetical protein
MSSARTSVNPQNCELLLAVVALVLLLAASAAQAAAEYHPQDVVFWR